MEGDTALSGKCAVAPHPEWSEQEIWVWEKVCAGENADFNKDEKYKKEDGREPEPGKPEGWPDERIINPKFLEKILLDEPYRSAIPRQGVQILGAWFKEDVDLSNSPLAHQLWLDKSRFDSDVDLTLLKSPYSISFDGSTFGGKLDMNSLAVGQHLFMRGGAKFKDVVLRSARVGGQLSMTGSTFEGTLNMDSLEVKGSLFMSDGATFNDVYLRGARVGGQLSMIGSIFEGALDMDSLEVEGSLFMRESARFKDVVLRSARVGGQLSMIGSTCEGTLDMNSLKVDQHLFMSERATFKKDVVLRGARVGGQLALIGSIFDGALDMDSLKVESSLLMRGGAKFKDVVLRGSRVGSKLEMDGSTFEGTLNMDSLKVESSLLMRGGAKFKDMVLRSAKVWGQIDMTGSTFEGTLDMDGLEVGQHLFMRDGEFKQPIEMPDASINGTLDMSGGKFISTNSTGMSINLTGAYIKGELMLGSGKHPKPEWEEKAKLILRNVKAGAIQDLQDSWDNLELILDGFTYFSLGGYAAGSEHSMAYRDVKWLTGWLERQKYYSPQPYEQLGRVLMESGEKGKAKAVLHAGKKRERGKAKVLSKLWLCLQELFVGYGYRNYYALIWVLGFTLIGFLVLWKTGQGKVEGNILIKQWYDQLLYSFDMLLPIVKLNEAHYDKVELAGFARYYFYYFQKIIGYVLASALIAGLSGITKK